MMQIAITLSFISVVLFGLFIEFLYYVLVSKIPECIRTPEKSQGIFTFLTRPVCRRCGSQ